MKAIGRSYLLIFLFLSGSGLAQSTRPPDRLQPFIQELDKAATEAVKGPACPSLTIGLVDKSGLVWTKSYGYANVDQHLPAKADTVYRIGSITKQFTAIMLLQLVRDGKVHFSDPVEKYFPEINQVQGRFPDAPPITLLQLATHTSGLGREPDNIDTYTTGPFSQWEKTLIAALPHTKFELEPGTHFSYSNIGYAILGAALGRAAHQPYSEYVKQRILAPLGMSHSDFEATDLIRPNLATGYLPENDKLDSTLPEKEHAGRGYKVPNGALYTTVGDLARFESFELLGGPAAVLSKDEINQNRQRLVAATAELNSGYGIGFDIHREGAHVFLGHSGGVAGYISFAYVEPSADLGIIILENGMDGAALNKLANMFFHRGDEKDSHH